MRQKRFMEEQIIGILKEAGAVVLDLRRQRGMSRRPLTLCWSACLSARIG